MKKEEKATAVIGLIVIIAICLMLIAVAVVFIMNNGGFSAASKEPPETAAISYLNEFREYAAFTDGTRLYFESEPENEENLELYNILKGRLRVEVTETVQEKRNAEVTVNLTVPDMNSVKSALRSSVENYLEASAKSANIKSDIYSDDDTYKEEILSAAYNNALQEFSGNITEMKVESSLVLRNRGGWIVENGTNVSNDFDSIASSLCSEVMTDLPIYNVTYKIEETALKGTTPDPNGWTETDDPSVIAALLETDTAKSLIGDETVLWSQDIEFKSGSIIRCYLDESILMINWQETEAKTCGTFSEVFIADGSQIRRKIAGDTFGDMNFETTTDFAADTNAILAVGGDFYNHARNCGIVVYDRTVYRFDPLTCDVCYITTDGDMLFSYRNQFSDISEVNQFIADNDILYSISFGPVLVDNGVDVTPSEYPWGEINDTYARSCLGMLGKHHYLTMNLNCELPHHWFLATLRTAADAMIKRGCTKVYALDGGQTATTVVNYKLVNPVQFGAQRQISDIIYFCSAVPRE